MSSQERGRGGSRGRARWIAGRRRRGLMKLDLKDRRWSGWVREEGPASRGRAARAHPAATGTDRDPHQTPTASGHTGIDWPRGGSPKPSIGSGAGLADQTRTFRQSVPVRRVEEGWGLLHPPEALGFAPTRRAR